MDAKTEIAVKTTDIVQKLAMATNEIGKARYSDGRPGKWPRLEELYDKLFPGETYPAHNAIEDVRALERCFRECVKREIIKI